jgi:hypothetical protein
MPLGVYRARDTRGQVQHGALALEVPGFVFACREMSQRDTGQRA